MVIFLVLLTLWVVAGTATFRRTGHAALEKARVANEYRDKVRNKIGNHHGIICYRGPTYGDTLGRKHACDCHLARRAKSHIAMVAITSYLFWPLYLVGYGYVNAQKKFLDYKGEEWSFFVPAKMVKTKDERIAELEANIDKLESMNGMEKI